MCHPSDPLCIMVPRLASLDNMLPYRPLPVAVVSDLMARSAPRLPAHLTRALFVAKHTSHATHLPIYDVTKVYTKKMQDKPFGSAAYQVNMMFLPRPRGDGTDANVCYFVNVDAKRNVVTVEKRDKELPTRQSVTV